MIKLELLDIQNGQIACMLKFKHDLLGSLIERKI